ncbi:Scr1 family TA system antitoxin-like transcriptional regulator [Cryptosporangium sp. NPDC048952]|uniref:helix-turn-helix domain-containing protein n=1 Tax=Cryptosporangium sp. NPDC048952 TaxID=3363961 RepID=UPI00371DC10B
MISPYVRRRRLAAELIALREEYGYSSAKLAATIGVARQRISRLENGHVRPDLDEVMRILGALGVGERRWNQIMTIAREAQERGWWEKYATEMGPRQALYANLEAGACKVREYQMTFLPGLLQMPAFTEARAQADQRTYAEHYDPIRALEARAARQRVMRRPGGPTYAVLLDELAIRRHAAPLDVVTAQLRHLVELIDTNARVDLRVLPIAAEIFGHAMPRSAFSIYEYPDPDDPMVVAVDTVTSDLVLTDGDAVSKYLTLYQRLKDAALSAQDSAELIRAAADLALPR